LRCPDNGPAPMMFRQNNGEQNRPRRTTFD
jgi:hypothetical protein